MPKTKEKIYTSLKGKFFCPNCHREVAMPIQLGDNQFFGTIRINCGNCKNGVVVIKGKQEIKNEEAK